MLDVITIGSATQDVFLESADFTLINSKKFSTGVGECFAFGSKVDVQHIVFDTGGGATNAATTFANLGFSVAALCRIGGDVAGDAVREALKRARVRRSLLILDKKMHTGYAVLLMAKGGERTVLVHRGASAHWSPKKLSLTKMRARWFYISSLAGHLATLRSIYRFAHDKQTAIAWNPGKAELRHGLKALRPLLARTDVFLVNKEEGRLLLSDSSLTVKNVVTQLRAVCPGTVFVTDGKRGGFAGSNEGLFSVAATKHKRVNATGAGDASGSGFVAGLLRGLSIQESLQIAALNSGNVVTKTGAKNGLLTTWPTKQMRAKASIRRM